MIQRILNLDPLGFNPVLVFELCWNQSSAARQILGLIPARGLTPIQYLAFLIRTRRADAAFDAWPKALAAADANRNTAAEAYDIDTLTGFAEFLTGADRIPEAVTVWNQMVERGMIHSGRLDPAKGISIADPDFQFAPLAQAFGWRMAEVPGVAASRVSGALRFEINGDEPQSFQILSAFAPVLSAARYHLLWKSDGSSLNAPQDPGLGFQIVQEPGDAVTQCPPLLSSASCDFETPADGTPGHVRKALIDLRYTRAQGTTRVSGTVQLFSVRLELAR